jgi:hypothetical protein
MSATKGATHLPASEEEHALPDGRQLVLSWEGDEGEINLHAPDGALELTLRITPDGPVLQMSGGRVELSATESISLQSHNLHFSSTEKTTIESGGKGIEIKTTGDMELTADSEVRVLASMIHLN